PKHYRDKLMREVRACVRRRMDAVFAEQERNGQQQRQMGEGDRLNMLTHLVKEDLEFVRDELVGCFPSSYEIFEVFVREYHAVVVEQTDPLVEQPGLLEGGDIVGLLQWARQHQMVMRKELGVPREYLEPPLLGGQEERLSQALLDIICRNVGQWLQNDLAAKTQIFVERAEPPTVYYKYYTMGIPGIVFKILHEQIGLIKESNRAKLLCDFFTQVRVLLGHNHQAWKTIMDRETQRQIKRPEEVAPGLVDYGIALINDQYQCVRETENIAGSLEGSLSRTYQERAAADLEGMKQDFSEVMEFGMDSLVEIVYSDLSEVVEMLFTPAWYKGDLLEPVVKTLEDYCADFEANLNPGVLARLVQKLMERFVVVYLEAAHMNKKVSFKKGEAGNKIRDEMRTASKFFIRFVARATVNEVFKPVEFMVSLIEQPPSVIVIEFLNVKSKFPDVPLQFIEDVLSKRSDASKANFKSVIESLRADANSQANMIVVKPTLFSKLRSYK
ncbi:SNARE-binding exocyst subunit S6, partial [Spiromyces aspiralis]